MVEEEELWKCVLCEYKFRQCSFHIRIYFVKMIACKIVCTHLVKSLELLRCFSMKSKAHQRCIYLRKNTVKLRYC